MLVCGISKNGKLNVLTKYIYDDAKNSENMYKIV